MKKYLNFFISLSIIFGFGISVQAAPEDDYPNFYADVTWDIPAGMEDYTVPTKFAPSTDGITGFNPFCKEADCGGDHGEPEFKTIHDYIRDYTEETIAGATTPEEAAKKIFYEVRDFIEYENIDFFGAFFCLQVQGR